MTSKVGVFDHGKDRTGCKCGEPRKKAMEHWVVRVYHGNYSAFHGYRFQKSAYSEVQCTTCGAIWRTKAKYVEELPVVPW